MTTSRGDDFGGKSTEPKFIRIWQAGQWALAALKKLSFIDNLCNVEIEQNIVKC
jgi:hypothetical protein